MASNFSLAPAATGSDSAPIPAAQTTAEAVAALAQVDSTPPDTQQTSAIHSAQAESELVQGETSPQAHSLFHDPHYLDSNQAAAAAAVAAQHGLQALEAANGLPSPSLPTAMPHYSPPSEMAYLTSGPSENETLRTSLQHPAQGPRQSSTKPTFKRLSKACDLCSQRKVKCDGQHPCRPCTELKVDCAYNRETKRRGPPNRHAEAARKKVKMSDSGSDHAAETLMSISGQNPDVLDAEVIAPWAVLVMLVEDYFTYIYPLVPFPHEPTFRERFHQRADREDREFLALLASMIGVLAASFPRSVRHHLKTQHSMAQFPRAIVMVERCRELALQARGPLFEAKQPVTVYDAATSYFLGLAGGYTMEPQICTRFMGQSLTFLRELGYDRPHHLRIQEAAQQGRALNTVEEEIGKRVFYVLFLGIRSMNQLGLAGTPILPSHSTSNSYPEWPTVYDDEYITPQGFTAQPEGTVSLLVGFTKAIEIYMTMQALVNIDLCYGQDIGFPDQKPMIRESLRLVKAAMQNLPQELTLDLSGAPSLAPVAPIGLEERDLTYHPPAWPNLQPATDIRHTFASQPERRRPLQYEIQKANIYISLLSTRSWYVERYFELRTKYFAELAARRDEAHDLVLKAEEAETASIAQEGVANHEANLSPEELQQAVARARDEATALDVEFELLRRNEDEPDAEMAAEREQIVQDLLKVITSISQRNMEPNGASIINKIRAVAGTLYSDDATPEAARDQALNPQLLRFFDVLKSLEKSGSATGGVPQPGSGPMSSSDEEEELRAWANLREEQLRFLSQPGYTRV